MLDPVEFGKELAKLIDAATAPLKERIKQLESVTPAAGKDGEKGADGKSVTIDDVSIFLDAAIAKWALEFERRANDILQKAIDKIPAPEKGADGANGKDGVDGKDGLGFDDLTVDYDGQKTVTFKFLREGKEKSFPFTLPVVIDKGIYKDATQYEAGDGVTWAGSFWIAQKATTSKPDSGEGWRLAVKRGRDGKDGRNGIDKTAVVQVSNDK